MEAVNTDDQPKNSVKQMRKISEFLCASSFLEKSVSVMSIMMASEIKMDSLMIEFSSVTTTCLYDLQFVKNVLHPRLFIF